VDGVLDRIVNPEKWRDETRESLPV
jgi:hypothetical protein